jgi:ABC-type transport system involved in multi-copper enzyme maturation permease subunit
MSALLRAELMKLRTTRTFVALAGAALALSLLVVVLTALLTKSFTERNVRELFTADFTGLFILLLGVVGMAGEWRHRTITSTVLAAPNRLRLLAAKTLSYGLAGTLLSFIVTVTIMLVGTLILSSRGEPTIGVAELADVLWRNLLLAALFGALGVCIGALVRNQTVAVVGVLIFAFVLEPAIVALASEVGRFGPTVGAPNGILETQPFDDDSDLLAPAVAALVLLG